MTFVATYHATTLRHSHGAASNDDHSVAKAPRCDERLTSGVVNDKTDETRAVWSDCSA